MNIRERLFTNTKTAILALYTLNLLIMGVHVLFFTAFALTHVYTLMFLNIFSVLTYVGCFYLINRQYLSAYTVIVSFEIWIHMVMAVYCLGWDYGFQLYFMVCVPIIFYMDYFSVKVTGRHVPGVPLSAVSALMFFVVLFYSRYNQPVYVLDEEIAFSAQALNSFLVIGFTAVFLGGLARIATNTETELERQATHDRLTGLANRNFLIERMNAIYAEENLENYWLAILDIDDFKLINDLYGHNCGDYVLKGVADIIRDNSEELTPCRWGGEEFVLMGREERFPDGRKKSREVLERIRRTVEEKIFLYEGISISLTVTIGLASHVGGQTVDEWINMADQKLYVGKSEGKNRLVM